MYRVYSKLTVAQSQYASVYYTSLHTMQSLHVHGNSYKQLLFAFKWELWAEAACCKNALCCCNDSLGVTSQPAFGTDTSLPGPSSRPGDLSLVLCWNGKWLHALCFLSTLQQDPHQHEFESFSTAFPWTPFISRLSCHSF